MCERWREEFGKEIDNPDQHFRLVYLTSHPDLDDAKIAIALKDARIAVMRPETLGEETREALADLMAAEQMKRNCSAPNQSTLREYADGKRREAIKAVLKCQQDEYRRGKVITQKAYAIPAVEIFRTMQRREEDLAGRLLWKKPTIPRCSAPGSPQGVDRRRRQEGLRRTLPQGPCQSGKGRGDQLRHRPRARRQVASCRVQPDLLTGPGQSARASGGTIGPALSDLKAVLCRLPYGLTESMVTLYVFALIKSGGFELALNPNAGVTLSDGRLYQAIDSRPYPAPV